VWALWSWGGTAGIIRKVTVSRLLRVEDAPVLADLYRTGRDFLAPWMPVRAGSYLTPAGQRRAIEEVLALHKQGAAVPHVILDSGEVVGRVTLSNVSRASFQSCNLGYWVSEAHNGRGLATAAVREMMRLAFGELGLHRIEAGALPENVRSQAVLERNGFARFGLARAYLHVAGAWRDHVLFQALAEPEPAPEPEPQPAAADVVHAFYAVQRCFYAGEDVDEELARFLAPDVAWHVPGRNAIAGDYAGRDQVLTYFRARRDLAHRSFVVTPRGTLSDDRRVVHFADGEAVLNGQVRRWRTVGIFELAGGRITECWLLPFDQAAFDAIWSAAEQVDG
jgi:ribosomal-protein-alanine N-acetyltransferase